MKRLVFTSILVTVLNSAVMAQNGGTDDQADQRATMFSNIRQLIGGMRALGDWDEHHGYIVDAANRIYERNGWTTAEDDFSLEMLETVGKIPPWQFTGRVKAITKMVTERYSLDEQQQRRLWQLMQGQANEVFMKHSGQILEYSLEAIKTRAAGEAVTPEQVARWTELAIPVIEDSYAMMQGRIDEFMAELTPEQQKIVQRDVDAANERYRTFLEQSDRWREGEWDPADWGLDADPIQIAGEIKRAEGEVQAGGEQQPTTRPQDQVAQDQEGKKVESKKRAVAQPKDPWTEYVKSLIAKYRLNKDQTQVCWRIHNVMVQRRDAVEKRYSQLMSETAKRFKDDLAKRDSALQRYERQQKEVTSRLFEQMKARLNRIPTMAQRKRVRTTTRPTSPKK